MSNRKGHKLDIVFYVQGMTFNGDSLSKHSLGGSETMGLIMAREMAKRGHDVTMFCNTDKPGNYDGVTYLPAEHYFNYVMYTPHDVAIVQRIPGIFNNKTKAKINILWNHDLAMKRARGEFRGALWNIDEVFGLTDYHIDQMSEIYGTPKEAFWKTRNSIDKVKLKKDLKRNPKRLIYTARPERGLDTLLQMMLKIWGQDPDIELHIAGYDNTVEQMKPFYNACENTIKSYAEKGYKVKHLGALTKQQLYKEYQQASLYVYPTDFEEISCITAMECMANGLPIVSSKLAALPETLNDKCAALIEGNSKTEEYQEKFITTTLRLINEPVWQEKMRQAGIIRAREFTSPKLAEEWESHFYDMFTERVSNKEALANQFYRSEDIMALRHLIDNERVVKSGTACPHKLDIKWARVLKNEYAIIQDPQVYDALYVEYGKSFKEKFDTGTLQVQLNMYDRIARAMTKMGKPKKILDYGGAIGNEAIQFVNAFDCEVTTVNISEDEQAVGKELAEKHCKSPEKITWLIASTPDAIEGQFDIIMAGEILEHVADPQKLINQLEAKCTKSGKLVFTVPIGPWGDTYSTLEQRGHLWSFDRQDILELFGQKKNLNAETIPGGANEKNRETLGWFVISYDKSKAPTGEVNLDRKCAIQAPRETLSVCMIIGGEQEGLLHRALKSVYHVADEIIIADTGMSEPCYGIIEHYKDKVKVIPNVCNPLEEGFETARNESIKHVTCDWILWIDSDEELLLPENMLKYLKANAHNGYAIRQHHFSARPANAFKCDMPIRLFRNNKGIKFFGMVHEHPETELNAGVGDSTILGDVDIAHDGYLIEENRRKRFDRNYPLLMKDREKYPERVLGKFLEMRDWMHIARYSIENNGNQMTQEAAEYCEKTVERFKTEFLGKPSLMSSDGLMYYNEALHLLCRGNLYNVALNINDMKEDDMIMSRFESKEDFVSYLKNKIDNHLEQYEGPYA